MSSRKYWLVLASAWLLVGCSSAPSPMLGTWTATVEGSTIPVGVFEFQQNGTFVGKIPGPISTIKGSYTLEDRNLTLDPETNDGKPTNDPNIACKLAEDHKSFSMNTGYSFVHFVKD